MLTVALKEWSIVCDLLREGRTAVLLRKGGIRESGGAGVFELEHRRFGLFPSWAHQQPSRIKTPWCDRVEVQDEPVRVTIRAIAEAAAIWEVPNRAAVDAVDDLHCWTPPQIDMRFAYKPQRPLYLVALRVASMTRPYTMDLDAEYAGCRSWVPLRSEDALDDTGMDTVIDDRAFTAIVERLDEAMGSSGRSANEKIEK